MSKEKIQAGKSAKKSKDDWRNYRESWQSCLSDDDRDRLNQIELARLKKAAGGNAVVGSGRPTPDDEDSNNTVKQEVMSSNEEESSSAADNNRRIGWLSGLFANPTWLLTRRRKVTKAEKRARKAFRTITVIVGTFAMFWSPYYIVATVYGFCAWCVPPALFFTSYYLCYLNSSMNPFAYAFANRLFRKTFIRILRGDWRNT
uniref:G-protein coupled receptors family 1 profile domain-containing protein n=1 Tax=Romanomermis culicivorax TaxID=13658 RepID=A0A915HNG0_ROMCU